MSKSSETQEGYIQYESVFVAGYQYYDGAVIERKLREGDQLELRRDGYNPYDHQAVEIFSQQDLKLGYLPADQNKMTAFFLDQGIDLKAVVREVRLDHDTWTRIRVDLFISDSIRGN
jgi:hypothetical protein